MNDSPPTFSTPPATTASGRPVEFPELLAPAGSHEAGLAALRYGADAVYAGLRRFSARAEADNFGPEELRDLAARAHARPGRPARVYVALNTLLKAGELPEATRAVYEVLRAGADGAIVQDIAMARRVSRCRADFPEVTFRLHASTQMAVHSAAGCRTLGRLGFDRVVLARELTMPEIAEAATHGGVETEIFIHGALCYAYSGLCLFSSMAGGRSGNRGRCSYPCRAHCTPTGRGAKAGHAFSLKDLAVYEGVRGLAALGVTSLKIEGRKKSPLYVSVVVDIYRRLLDGTLSGAELASAASDLETVFSRPTTRFFLDGPNNPEAADIEVVGHRGGWCGTVETVGGRPGARVLRFHSARALERHDGLQLDLPGHARPYGFAVTTLRAVGRGGNVFGMPAGAEVEVGLPADAPEIPTAVPVYCASSQAVKRKYAPSGPPPGEETARTSTCGCSRLALTVRLGPGTVDVHASFSPEGAAFDWSSPAATQAARDVGAAEAAALRAFERLGGTRLRLASFAFDNPEGLFLPPGAWNALRRAFAEAAERFVDGEWRGKVERAEAAVSAHGQDLGGATGGGQTGTETAAVGQWSVYVDRIGTLVEFADEDWLGVDEVVVGLERDGPETLREGVEALSESVGREKIRLALPILGRPPRRAAVRERIAAWLGAGWKRWLVANWWGWDALNGAGSGGFDPTRWTGTRAAGFPRLAGDGMDVALDWPFHTLNPDAARSWREMGATRCTWSPEGSAADFVGSGGDGDSGRGWTVVYQDVPLFISAACARSHLTGCSGQAAKDGRCATAPLTVAMDPFGETVLWPQACGTVALGREPYSLSRRLGELAAAGRDAWRVDLLYRPYAPDEAVRIWRRFRAGKPVPGHEGNYARTLL